MPSPFPGMDPYLEPRWGDVHTSCAVYIRNQLNKQLPEGFVARVESSIAVEIDDADDEDIVRYFPDVQIETARRDRGESATLTAAEPIVVSWNSEPESIRSVRITTRDGARLVTAIEILSPSNKVGRSGREAFRRKQAAVLEAKASLVVIDLLRAGRHVIAVPLAQLPARARHGYKAVVFRGWVPKKAEVYALSMREPLPVIRVPLTQRDPDALLDLQAILDAAYDDGGYGSINYRTPLDPALSPADEKWIAKHLKAAKKR